MTQPEGLPQPLAAYVKLEEFTPELLGDIAGIYKETVGGNPDYWVPKGREEAAYQEVINNWDRYGAYSNEYRLGSRLSMHSKLWLVKQRAEEWDRVEVSFDGNMSTKDDSKLREQVRELKANFAQRVQERIDRKEEN